jgi:uncharacterized membrane protein
MSDGRDGGTSEDPAPSAEHQAPAAARYPPPPSSEPHWPPQLTVVAAIALQVLLPDRLSVGSRWVLPALEVVMLIGLVLGSPQQLQGPHSRRRVLALVIAALVSLANGISLVLLSRLLLDHNVSQGKSLIVSGSLIWLTNVLVFALWYWELDREGPGLRAAGRDGEPDFLYPQMTELELFPSWRPRFADYLYVSLTNATAFSPTDTMPLSVQAKLLMGLQSLVSLVTIGLVVSRAVNIL